LITHHGEKEMQGVTPEVEEFEKTICKENKNKNFFKIL
jgi:hypothetical protein